MLHRTSSGEPCALVGNIQKYTIHDGPGIRTSVFFTGCTMRCLWCSNPEMIEPGIRLGVYPAKCLSREKCGYCVKNCPLTRIFHRGSTASAQSGMSAALRLFGRLDILCNMPASPSLHAPCSHARLRRLATNPHEISGVPRMVCGDHPIEFNENGILKMINMRAECDNCFKCADACPPRAIKQWGEKMTLTDLMKIITEDKSFYRRTGGGVTLNGGEVMLQWEFARMLLKACRETGINTCVETALHCPVEHMEAVYEYTDLVIADIKHMDTNKHREYTGVGNELILSNIKRTVEMKKKLVIRTPVVPGYNGDEENIRKTGVFIRDDLGGDAVVQYQLLPYRKMGIEKYDSLGAPYPMSGYEPPERSEWEVNLTSLADMLVNEYKLPAVAGSGRKIRILSTSH